MSILLAFAIEAAWQRQQERSEVRAYLETLRGEFVAARTQLDTLAAKNEGTIRATLTVVRSEPPEMEALSTDSAEALYTAIMTSQTFDPSLGVLSALQASGALDDVSDPELRGALGDWPGLVDDIKEDVYPMWETALGTVDRWSDLGVVVSMLALGEGVGDDSDARSVLTATAADDLARNRLAARAIFHRVYQTELNGLSARVERVLTLIDQEIGP